MSDYYVEVLVERDTKVETKKRKVVAFITMATLFLLGIVTMLPILWGLLAISIVGYYFFVQNYYIEFEYFYMDGELVISKIINKSRRKSILEIQDGLIKLVAPINSEELNQYSNLEKKDCTANELSESVYSVVYANRGQWKIVNLQMSDELYKELKRNMPYKVKNC